MRAEKEATSAREQLEAKKQNEVALVKELQETREKLQACEEELSKRKGERKTISGLSLKDLTFLEEETRESWERVRDGLERERKAQKDKIEEGLACSICYENPKNRIIKPCCHLICDVCLGKVKEARGKCPLCRGKIKGSAVFDLFGN